MAYINKDVSTMAMPSGMNRMGQFPLDMSSVFYNEAELRTYATSGAIAYVGQIVSLVDETNKKVTVYSIQNTEGLLKEVGTIPLGDDKSIEVVDGKIAMHDYGVAYYEYVPEVKDDEGNVTKEASYAKVTVSESKPWKAGLEPKVVTEDGKLVIGWFEPNPTTIEGVNDQVTAVQGTVADLETSVGAPSAEGQPATGLYKEVEDVQADVEELVDSVGNENDSLGEDVNTLWANVNDHKERIEALEEKEDADTKYHLEYSSENKEIKLVVGEGTMTVDATPFIKDGMLHDVDYDAENQELVFQWNTDAGITEDRVPVSGLVDVYTAGNGLKVENNQFSVVLDTAGESFLTLSASGLKLSGVQAAINTAKQEAISAAASDATSKANAAEANAKAHAETKATEAKEAAIADAAEKYATKAALKETDDKAVSNTTAIENLTGRLDGIVAQGGEPNLINNIKVNNVVQPIAEDKSVNIVVPTKVSDLTDDTGFDGRITAAQNKANEAAGAAATAQSAAEAAQNAAEVADGKAVTNANAIKALQEADVTANGKIQALEVAVNNETSGLAATHAKAVQNAADIATLTAKDATHDSDIAGLKTKTGNNETAITNLQTAVGNVYTKSESDGKYATKAEVGTPTSGKTIVQMIAEAQAAATYDDTKVKEDIQKNATAIENITKEGGAIATAVAAEAEIARAAEKDLADDIAEINALLNTVSSEDQITSLKELAIWVEEHGGEASKMAESIKANADAIELINDAENGILVKAKAHSDSNLATAKAYTDAEIAKIHGVDNKTIKLAENKAYVAEVSTDILVQGAQELVLCGGNASGFGSNS